MSSGGAWRQLSDQLGRPAFWRFTDALAAGWRRVPLRGPGRILDAALRHATRRFGDGVIEVGAGKVLINSTNPPEASLFWWRSYEDDVTAGIEPSLRRGMTAIDVGANCGVVTLLIREAVGSEGLVLKHRPVAGGVSASG